MPCWISSWTRIKVQAVAGASSPFAANWDTNNHFSLTVSAPPNMKFLVTVPPQRLVRFGGFLWWESTRGGFSAAG